MWTVAAEPKARRRGGATLQVCTPPRQSVVSLDEMTESTYNLGLLELLFERCSKSNRKLMLNRESGRKGCLNGD
jgi:hypothetical protein